MNSAKIDVLCVGLASYDLVYPVERHPEADEKCFATGLVMCGGGPAANAAVAVARLGGTTAFAGYLSTDVFGELHFREFVLEGVMTDLVVRGDSPAMISSIIVKPDGKRTVVTHKGTTPVLEPDRVDFSKVSPRAILFDGHQPVISVPLAQMARERNIPTVLDAGSVHKGTLELAPLCGCLAASEKFARDLSGEKDPAAALGFLANMVPVTIITLGEAGLVWASRTEPGNRISKSQEQSDTRHRPSGLRVGSLGAYPVEAVDTTGAGDIFHGALALAMAREQELLSALRFASAAAALGCTRMGARPSIPTRAEVETLMRRESQTIF